MDSTTPDPQQAHGPLPPQPPQQQQYQQHHQQQLPHQQAPAAQHHQTGPISYQTISHQPLNYGPNFAAPHYQPRYPYPGQTYAHAAYQQYPNYGNPPTWNPAAQFNPVQPLSNMVNTQPQTATTTTNVPQQQQHNKSSQIINPTNDQRSAPVTVPNTNSRPARERKPAILKDPSTKKEVPLSRVVPASKFSSSSTAVPASATSTLAATTNPMSSNTSTSTNTTTSNVDHVHTLLQKVSEDNNSDEITKNKKQQASTNSTITTTNAVTTTSTECKSNSNKNATPKKEVIVAAPKKEVSVATPNKEVSAATSKKEVNITAPQKEVDIAASQKEVNIAEGDNSKDTTKVNGNQSSKSADSKEDIKESVVQNEKKVVNDEVNGKNDNKENVTNAADNEDVEKIEPEEGGGKDEEEKKDPLGELNYEPEQYNPRTNKNGRKVYSRQFLMDVYEKLVKPTCDKSAKDIIQSFSENNDPFAPSYQRLNQSNRQNDPLRWPNQPFNYAGRSSGGQERPRKVITSASLTQEVELKTTSNPWKPGKELKEDAPNDEVETELLKKKFRSILNKLTPNNFDSLSRAVTDLSVDTESKLGDLIDIVFAKALAEPGYCVLYGQMCSHLKKITAGTANFGNTLLKRCQIQFNSDIYAGINLKEREEKIEAETNPDIKKQLNEELYEDMYRCRMRGLGLIKFIGELYKIEMLNDAIMFECVVRLLSDKSEESLECLCDLLATIGEKLDKSKKKNAEKEKKAPKSASKANAYQGGQKSAAAVVASGSTSSQQKMVEPQVTLDQVFEQLNKIRKDKELDLSVRIRFKLLDTIELREKDNWQSKKSKDNNPKKIEEIREAHKEKLDAEKKQNAMGPRRSQEGRRLPHSGGSSSQLSSLAVDGGRASNMHTSSSSHTIRELSYGDNMKSTYNNDIETQKEHQKNIEKLNISGILANAVSKTSAPNDLRPSRAFGMKKP